MNDAKKPSKNWIPDDFFMKSASSISEILKIRNPSNAIDLLSGLSVNSADYRSTFDDAMSFFRDREEYIKEFCFSIITIETCNALAEILKSKSILEVGAGTGALSLALKSNGLKVLSSDFGAGRFSGYGMSKIWDRDHEGDSLELLPGDFDAVVMAWPAYEQDFAFRVTNAMRPGQTLVYLGEGPGGCCADQDFFDETSNPRWIYKREESLALNENHLRFPHIHDRWAVLEKV